MGHGACHALRRQQGQFLIARLRCQIQGAPPLDLASFFIARPTGQHGMPHRGLGPPTVIVHNLGQRLQGLDVFPLRRAPA